MAAGAVTRLELRAWLNSPERVERGWVVETTRDQVGYVDRYLMHRGVGAYVEIDRATVTVGARDADGALTPVVSRTYARMTVAWGVVTGCRGLRELRRQLERR